MLDNLLVQNIPLNAVSNILRLKLGAYAWVFNRMSANQGRFPYPAWFIGYLDALGVEHWAEYYFKAKITPLIEEARSTGNFLTEMIYEQYGSNPTNEQIIECIKLLSDNIEDFYSNLKELHFLESDPKVSFLDELPEEERSTQKHILMLFLIAFLNDLSIASHGESLYVLVQKAIEQEDVEAFVKAIQIDPTITHYFNKKITFQSLSGDSDFFDQLSYRVKNPPLRGQVKHPLLWVLFKDLSVFGCLRKGITNRQILDLLNDSVKEHPEFLIVDEQIVQRQRRKFISKYRLLK